MILPCLQGLLLWNPSELVSPSFFVSFTVPHSQLIDHGASFAACLANALTVMHLSKRKESFAYLGACSRGMQQGRTPHMPRLLSFMKLTKD